MQGVNVIVRSEFETETERPDKVIKLNHKIVWLRAESGSSGSIKISESFERSSLSLAPKREFPNFTL